MTDLAYVCGPLFGVEETAREFLDMCVRYINSSLYTDMRYLKFKIANR